MAQIVPTITAENAHTYREQIERVEPFAKRVHIDLMDGVFTKNTSVLPEQVWWPDGIQADVHVMFQDPHATVEKLVALKPNLVIVQAESDADVESIAKLLNDNGIKCGLSVLPQTTIESVKDKLGLVQQLLLFSGNLGHQGGSTADLSLLAKADQVKAVDQTLEIAWDGGANITNVQELSKKVDVINVGSAIHFAPDPAAEFATLQTKTM